MKLTLDTALMLFAGILSLAQIAFFVVFLANNTTDNLPLIVFLIIAPLANLLVLVRR
jgi:phosphoglycerol transferase MdoB-like AlkP superfamily enzyme